MEINLIVKESYNRIELQNSQRCVAKIGLI
jgi:hypothetical protein